jgi:hypothetical protein
MKYGLGSVQNFRIIFSRERFFLQKIKTPKNKNDKRKKTCSFSFSGWLCAAWPGIW